MIRKAVSLLTEHTKHPLLAALLLSSGLFLLIGGAIQATAGSPIVAGFMGVYAVIAFVMGALGYFMFFVSLGISRFRRQYQLE